MLLAGTFAVAAEKAVNLELAPLPKAVSSFGGAVVGDTLYVYGGHAGKAHTYSTEDVLGTFQSLKVAEGAKWEVLTGGPHLQGLAMVAHDGKVIRVGGMQPRNKVGDPADNHSVALVERYDPAAKKWEALAELPEARSSHDAVVLGDKLYVVGGWKMNGAGNDTKWHETAVVLDLAKPGSKWETIKQPFQRRALTAAAYQGKVYVICGMTSGGDLERTVNIYDPATKAWTTGPVVPEPKQNGFTPASAVSGDQLYLSTADGKVFRLGQKGEAWEEVASLKQPRFVHRLLPIDGGRVVALGGASKKGNVALTEVIGGK